MNTPYNDRPWFKSYDNEVPDSLDYDAICLPDILRRTARQYPDRTALIYEGTTLSYRELDEAVLRFASFLASWGVSPGDVVAILLPNLIPTVIAYFGALAAGTVVVMNNPLYTDPELEHQLNDAGATVLITLDLLANRMITLRARTSVRHIVYTTVGDYLPPLKKVLFTLFGRAKKLSAAVPRDEHVCTWATALTENSAALPDIPLTHDDTAMYQYTGGTTGIPKGVVLTHGNLSKQIQQFLAWAPEWARSSEIMMGALPFFHMFGLSTSMTLPLYAGWTSLLVPRPHSRALLTAIARYRPSLATMVPTMIIEMMHHPLFSKTDFSCFKSVVSGGSSIPIDVIRQFEESTGATIIEGYGLTEASPVTHVNPVGEKPRRAGSIGLPFPDTHCRIVDLERGTDDMPVDAAGELIIQGPQVMKGYLHMPDETAYARRDGWLYTGDIATMDEDGYFYIVDRKKDLIISKGYNIYPREIDEVLYTHPKVKEACTIGLPDPVRGETVTSLVVLKENESATEDELIEYCTTRLARYKLPRRIEFRSDLPKTNIGKILRKDIRQEVLDGDMDNERS